jgi:hypothetical protein
MILCRLTIHDQLASRHGHLDPHAKEVALLVVSVGLLDHDATARNAVVEGLELRGLSSDLLFNRFGTLDTSERDLNGNLHDAFSLLPIADIRSPHRTASDFILQRAQRERQFGDRVMMVALHLFVSRTQMRVLFGFHFVIVGESGFDLVGTPIINALAFCDELFVLSHHLVVLADLATMLGEGGHVRSESRFQLRNKPGLLALPFFDVLSPHLIFRLPGQMLGMDLLVDGHDFDLLP